MTNRQFSLGACSSHDLRVRLTDRRRATADLAARGIGYSQRAAVVTLRQLTAEVILYDDWNTESGGAINIAGPIYPGPPHSQCKPATAAPFSY